MHLFEMVEKEMIERLQWMAQSPTHIGAANASALLAQHYSQAVISTLEDRRDAKSADLIFANMILPWAGDLQTNLKNYQQQLRLDGLLMISCLGVDTLRELPQAKSAGLQLIDMHELGDQLIHAGFADPVLDVEQVVFRYQEPKKLITELQDLKLIEMHSVSGDIPLMITLEIIYAHAWCSERSNTGEFKIPLSHIKRSK